MEDNSNNIFSGLNPAQNEAVSKTEGPCLVLAGAGSGKTRVLTCRIANLIAAGVYPGRILALTFTKKAAGEMKDRISMLVGEEMTRQLWMGTFHSIFIRFLRQEAESLGFPQNFTIYDQSDSRSAIRQCIKELNLDEKTYKPNSVQNRISAAKNNLLTVAGYKNNAILYEEDCAARMPQIGNIYELYCEKCKRSGAMDFDDILLYTNILLRDNKEALEAIRGRFRYILVDEYQDTNLAQYIILRRLASEHHNLCVVGDDSQSIYAFRGARVENILNFKKDYPEAQIIRLEQNYRSTETIVNAANCLIEHNRNKLKKTCFSNLGAGEKINILSAYTDQEEGFLIANSIVQRIYSAKAAYKDFAVLYRTNAQSRIIEDSLRRRNLPYRVYAGMSFYDRAEIKDMLAYFRLVINPKDEEAFRRTVNTPARGIGETSIGHLANAAIASGAALFDAVLLPDAELMKHGLKGTAIARLRTFAAMIEELHQKVGYTDAYELAIEIGNHSEMLLTYKNDKSVEAQTKFENLESLFNSVKEYVEEESEIRANGEETPEGETITITLPEYLENITLLSSGERDVTSSDDDDSDNKITLMTVHASKGLEFPYVYVAGMEENLFPSTSMGMPSDIEEERRLFYVAITRAMKSVTLSFARNRMRWGKTETNEPSQFLRNIDPIYLNGEIPSHNAIREESNRQMTEAFESGIRSNFGSHGQFGEARHAPVSSRPTQPQRGSFQKPASSNGPTKVLSPAGAPKLHQHIPSADFAPSPISELREGQRVEHKTFGFRRLLSFEGKGADLKAIVEFEHNGTKTLMLKFAKLRIMAQDLQ